MIPRTRLRLRERGFTLVELALVMGIVALLLGGLMLPVARMLEQKATATTQATLETAQQALLGFALLNKRLPCPDIGTSGLEGTYDIATNRCSSLSSPSFSDSADASWGHLPWATLGVSGADAWGRRLRYTVPTPMASPVLGAFNAEVTSTTSSKLIIKCTTRTNTEVPNCFSSASSTTPITPTDKAVFVVYSLGKNGRGAVSMDGLSTVAAPPAGSDEFQNLPDSSGSSSNATSRRTFVSRLHTDAVNPAGEFDDLMVWMPASLLVAKLLAAGQWP
jgi:prepilin-type N-terminal cleavage/methylation domain-containing protein